MASTSRLPGPLVVKRFLRDPLLTVDRRRTAYRRLAKAVPGSLETFTDKLLHKMAHDRSPLLRTFADKVAVRDYVADRVGEGVLPALHGVFDTVEELDWDALPRNYVLKAAHGSGAVAVVWEGAPRGTSPGPQDQPSWGWRGLIHPDDLDRGELERLARGWLRMGYELRARRPEWAYGGIAPRLIVEELLLDTHGEIPSDYKFYMMHGRCSAIDVHQARFSDHRGAFMSPDWEPLAGNITGRRSPDVTFERPVNLGLMTEIAGSLSQEVDFLRVDLYDLGDRVVFGELTNYPGAAGRRFSPPTFDAELGAAWSPPRTYS